MSRHISHKGNDSRKIIKFEQRDKFAGPFYSMPNASQSEYPATPGLYHHKKEKKEEEKKRKYRIYTKKKNCMMVPIPGHLSAQNVTKHANALEGIMKEQRQSGIVAGCVDSENGVG